MALKPAICKFPIFPSAEKTIGVVGKNPFSFFLDSSDPSHPRSLNSFAGINPHAQLSGNHSPWSGLKEAYGEGWIVGYLSYENYRFVEPFNQGTKFEGPIPAHWFGLFDTILSLDHKKNEAHLCSWRLKSSEMKKKIDEWMGMLSDDTLTCKDARSRVSACCSFPDYQKYEEKFYRIREYLLAGDVYQINLTERFESRCFLSSSALYKRLRKLSPVPYGAFLNAGDFQILSASPESFLNVNGDRVETCPIKGTRKRGGDDKKDRGLLSELLSSPKDRAELLMIVDLERNDLGKVCNYSSINVDPLFKVESFAQVHHLVAKVSGHLKNGAGPVEALRVLFPGGSVTGAPKKRAIEIIDELESSPRSVYTGALGFIGVDGRSQFNMPIRTLTKVGDQVYFHAGGGIVIDSDPRLEYEEMMIKASGMMKALGINTEAGSKRQEA